ncbi:hypothetical protein GCM10027563_22740 [Parasphingorhabdus pacifica]
MPGKDDIDPLLADWTGRLVVHGTDADLAAVVLRLMRKARLADVSVGYVPAVESPVSRLWGVPTGAAAFELAATGRADPAPLVRDDSGGVLLGAGTIEPITGKIYCDDQRVLAGTAVSVEVTPDPDAEALSEPTADPLATTLEPAEDGIRVAIVRRGLLRRRRNVFRGRAVQARFDSAEVRIDGVAHPRPAQKWGWYRHTEDLLLAR